MSSPSRRKLAKPVARGAKTSIVRQCYKDENVLCSSARIMGQRVRQEIGHMCSNDSVLTQSSVCDIHNFTWEAIIEDLKKKAPILHILLKECTRTRKERATSQIAIIGMIVEVMYKYRCATASLVQKNIVNSVIWRKHYKTCK